MLKGKINFAYYLLYHYPRILDFIFGYWFVLVSSVCGVYEHVNCTSLCSIVYCLTCLLLICSDIAVVHRKSSLNLFVRTMLLQPHSRGM